MSTREWNRLPWESGFKACGWPWHGFRYVDGGVVKLRTPAGTVVTGAPVSLLFGSKNIAWKIARPGWVPPPLPAEFVAQEDAKGRTWLGHGILARGIGFYNRYNAAGLVPYYVTATGPLVAVVPISYSAGDINSLANPKGIAGFEVKSARYGTVVQTITVDLAITLDAATAEFTGSNGVHWACADVSDNGHVSLWYNNDAVAVVRLFGEVPSMTATIEAVSARQYPDHRNMSHALMARSFSNTDTSITTDGYIQHVDYGEVTSSSRTVRAVDHDGTLLFFETSVFSRIDEYTDFDPAHVHYCDPTNAPTVWNYPRWRDSAESITATFAGVTVTGHSTNGPSLYAFDTNPISDGPIVHLKSRDVDYDPVITCFDNVITSITDTGSASIYKSTPLSSYVGDLSLEQFAVDPHSHELFIWPSGVSVV